MTDNRDGRTRSLAQVLPNETLRIERMLFEVLRDLCFGLGIAEGDVVRCRRSSDSIVLLETADGRTVLIDQDWARFIEVGSADAPMPRPAFDTAPPLRNRPAWPGRSRRHDPHPEAQSAR